MRGPVTFGGTARAALPLAVLAFLVNGTVVAVALQAVGVPGDHPMIDFPALLPASIGPVVGSAVGFALSYRRPGRLSFLGFVTPAVVITAVFVWLAVADFADHDDVGVLVTALLVTVLPTAIAIVGLPRLTPRGPARAPAAADPSGAARTGIWEVPGLGATPPQATPTADPADAARTGIWEVPGLGAAPRGRPTPGTRPAPARSTAPLDVSGPAPAPRAPDPHRTLDIGLPPSPLEGGPVAPDDR